MAKSYNLLKLAESKLFLIQNQLMLNLDPGPDQILLKASRSPKSISWGSGTHKGANTLRKEGVSL